MKMHRYFTIIYAQKYKICTSDIKRKSRNFRLGSLIPNKKNNHTQFKWCRYNIKTKTGQDAGQPGMPAGVPDKLRLNLLSYQK